MSTVESAAAGNAKAQVKLGLMSEKGWGVEKNLKEALRWYRASCESETGDEFEGSYICGWIFEFGRGVKKVSRRK
jgi:TPR repeat protein